MRIRRPRLHALQTADFDYDLPAELIAQNPLERRDDSRLLVLDRSSGSIHHSTFNSLGDWLAPGDLFVANNSRVIPARLRGRRVRSGGAVEILLLRKSDAGSWSALAKPAKRLKRGDRLEFPSRVPGMAPATATVEENLGGGELLLRFDEGADERLEVYGELPIPPYITECARGLRRDTKPSMRLSRVCRCADCRLALHRRIDRRPPAAGVRMGRSYASCRTRHVSTRHRGSHSSIIRFTESGAKFRLRRPRRSRHAAAEEAASSPSGRPRRERWKRLGQSWRDDDPTGFAGFTDTFIVPGHRWRLVDALLTNFHLPRSTLLMLVSALAGREAILQAYAEATRHRYRFYSFGDAMLIR